MDLKEEFISDYVWPTVKAGAVYEKKYLLGTSFARPLIAKKLVEIAEKEGADAIAHGATGKGNDQVRFELSVKALAPQLAIIAPWREWELRSRDQEIDYAAAHNIPIPVSHDHDYSMDRNMWHLSHEGSDLEDPWNAPKDELFIVTNIPEKAPDKPEYVELEYVEGVPVSVNGEKLSPAKLVEKLNEIGIRNAVGITDMVEDRLVGMKSRGVYENPAGVLTNNPPFPEQMFRLNDYMHLSPKQPQNHFSTELPLRSYSRGMGALGLPGDLSSQSRFVRAAFVRANSVSGNSETESVSQFFHILGAVDQQRGCCEVKDGQYEITIYTSCCNADKGIYYYTTYNNHQISAVHMHHENLDSSQLVCCPMQTKEQICHQN